MFLENFNPYLFLTFVWVIYLLNNLYLNYKLRYFLPKRKEEVLTIPFYLFFLFLSRKIAGYFWDTGSIGVLIPYLVIMGILFCLTAIALFIYLVYFEKNFPSCLTIKQMKPLKGIYNYIRHPSYSVSFLLIFGSAFCLQDIFLFFWACLTHISLYFFYITEEKQVSKEHPRYREYLKRTNRFLPRFSKIQENIFNDPTEENKTI